MLAHDSVTDAQPQACALAYFFSREERIKDPLRILNALAVIAEQDFHPTAVLYRLNLDQAGTAGCPHRVVGVVDDVEEHLLQLVRVANQLRQTLVKLLHYVHTLVGKVISAQSNGLSQNVINLQRLALWRTLPRKAHQLLPDFLAALLF